MQLRIQARLSIYEPKLYLTNKCSHKVKYMNNIREQIIDMGCRMMRDNLAIGTFGNISAIDSEGYMYVTPSGMPYDSLKPCDIVKMDLEGNILDGDRRPSIEHKLHIEVYKARSDSKAIIHTHPIYSTAFSAMGEDIPLFLDEAAQVLGDTVRIAEHALPGTDELAANCVKAIGSKANACLLQAHGAVCVGASLDKAYAVSEVLESTARIYSLIRSMGGSFIPLSESDISAMRYFAEHRYGQEK